MASLLAQSVEKIRKRELTIAVPSVPDEEYADWIELNEPREEELAEQRRIAREFPHRPLISIITPVWNPLTTLLEETIRSVIAQTYDNWELCLTDGRSNEEVRDVIREFADKEKRLSVQLLDSNLGISRNSNAAIERCKGEYVALLDHDDTIAPNALFEVVASLNKRPEADLIYSDRDHMTLEGKRTDPLFKPDWSPDLMLCTNYVVQLCVIRSTLLSELGGFRPETDGAQDWDLILRLAERTNKVFHVPRILYHWRQSPSSVSFASIRAKPYAKQAQLASLTEFMKRNRLAGAVRSQISGYPRIEWQVDSSQLVSIIIIDAHGTEALSRCINSIVKKSSHPNFEIIIVRDKAASSSKYPPQDVRIRIVGSSSTDFASGNNLAFTQCKGGLIVFLDARTEVLSVDWLQELAGWCSSPPVAAVGPQLLSVDGKISGGAIVVGLPNFLFKGSQQRSRTSLGFTEWYRNCTAVSGLCLATRSEVFRKVGRFDGKFGSAADLEFCLRTRSQNYRTIYTPQAKLIFHGSRDDVERPQVFRENPKLVMGDDPYFNPNLSYDSAIPMLNVDVTTSRIKTRAA